jgi:hypothetical protein
MIDVGTAGPANLENHKTACKGITQKISEHHLVPSVWYGLAGCDIAK